MQKNQPSSYDEDPGKPLVILSAAGGVAEVCATTLKGYQKSLETGRLWALHRSTGRLLPHESPEGFTSLVDRVDWYEAALARPDAVSGAAPLHGGQRTVDGETAGEESSASSASWEEVLGGLERLIRERKTLMPEGSYTTHLFSAGVDKIRKKTGEEAIELLLAGTAEETIYEAADLVYHLFVLLRELDISFSRVIDELARRGA